MYFVILFISYFFPYNNDACFDNLDFPLITNNLRASRGCMQLQIFNLRCLNSESAKIEKHEM